MKLSTLSIPGICAVVLVGTAAHAQDVDLNVTAGLHHMVYDYLTAIAQADWQARDAHIAELKTPDKMKERQRYVRAKLTELLGGFPEKTPLNARITGSFQRDGYRVEKLVYESRPHFYVTADLYVPLSGHAPYPAVLGVAGHTDNGKAAALYQRGWIGLAKRGYIVLAFDPPSQGERVQYFDPELGRSRVGTATAEHTAVGLQCFLTGSNVANYIVWDGIRGLDYLISRPDVDAKRLAVAGNSGGGMQAAYLAGIEQRLAAAAPSCYMTTSEKLWTDLGPQDAEQNMPGFLAAGLDLKDFPLAFAPKPFEFLTATRDFFPIAGAHEAFAEARHIYEIMGCPECVNFFEYNDTHGWSQPRREATYRWFQRWLNGMPADEGAEPAFQVEPEENLWATPSGQLETSLKGETVQSLNGHLAEQLAAARPPLSGERLKGAIVARLGISALHATPTVEHYGEVGRSGYRIEKITFEPESKVHIPALAFVPSADGGRRPAVLYLNPAGKAADAAPGGDLEALVRAGRIVLALDARGWGETADANTRVLTPHYSIAMRAMLVGRTLAGMQVTDVLSAFDYLRSRADVDPSRISLFAKGNAVVPGLLAAALEPGIANVACEGGPVSFLDIAKARFHGEIADIVIPGVLKDFDLPEVAASLAPRPLWIIDPRMPSGARAAINTVSAEYKSQDKNFRITSRLEGWKFDTVYSEWLKR